MPADSIQQVVRVATDKFHHVEVQQRFRRLEVQIKKRYSKAEGFQFSTAVGDVIVTFPIIRVCGDHQCGSFAVVQISANMMKQFFTGEAVGAAVFA